MWSDHPMVVISGAIESLGNGFVKGRIDPEGGVSDRLEDTLHDGRVVSSSQRLPILLERKELLGSEVEFRPFFTQSRLYG